MKTTQGTTAPIDTSKRRLLAFAAITPALYYSNAAFAAKDPIYTSLISNKAVGGYDVVSYYAGGEPLEGSGDFETDYKGATWQFASQENLDAFLANPEKYEPQYGGYCAYAVSQGYTAKGDPLQYTLDDGKLYLNYNASVKSQWMANQAEFITQGDKNWPNVLN